MSFFFQGRIPASKSVLNRCLLLQSYEPAIRISGDSECDDVRAMRGALAALARGESEIFCGEAALVFRLMALAASRKRGTFHITGSPRLLSRPHGVLLDLLGALGVQARLDSRSLEIRSEGWKAPQAPLDAGATISSQFLSSLVLNAWDLPFPLEISIPSGAVSRGYFEISLELALQAGLKWETGSDRIHIPAAQKARAVSLEAESDLSSAFAVAALAAVAGEARMEAFPKNSLQPDRAFIEILRAMGAPIEFADGTLLVRKAERLRAIDWNLKRAPDLFPVLALLCAFADGKSRLHGAPQLAHKESDRIAGVARLLDLLKRECRKLPDGIEIQGRLPRAIEVDSVDFNPDHDHRLAMAAAVATQAGYPIRITDLSVLGKSFPEFRSIAGLASD